MKAFNKNYFSKGYRMKESNNFLGKIGFNLRFFQERYAKHIPQFYLSLNYIYSLPKGAKVLDVGCGVGNWLRLINRCRPDIKLYGADIGDIEDFLPDYVNFIKCSGDNLDFEDEQFDMITCHHVLEHVLNPQDFVNEFYRVLKKGGYCFIETPSLRNCFFPGDSNFYHDPSHIKPFIRKGFRRLGSIVGFETLKDGFVRNYPINGLLLILFSPFSLLFSLFGYLKDMFTNFLGFTFGGVVYWIGKK